MVAAGIVFVEVRLAAGRRGVVTAKQTGELAASGCGAADPETGDLQAALAEFALGDGVGVNVSGILGEAVGGLDGG